MTLGSALAILTIVSSPRAAAPPTAPPVHAVKVTILSTMLAGDAGGGIGEWGFSALVEADGHRILYDTGARPNTVMTNARELGIDLSGITDVVLSHYHDDHTGGLLALRRELSKVNSAALSRAHVATGIFLSRRDPGSDREANSMIALRSEFEATGGRFEEGAGPVEIFPGVWLTGPVPRTYPEHNVSGHAQIPTPSGPKDDDIPEDQALVADADGGLVVVSGCAHAGIVNTLEYAQRRIRTGPIQAAIGGFHLFPADDATLAWTGAKLRELHVLSILGAHCTGIEALFRLREGAGLTRKTAVVGAVGASYTTGKGIDPRLLAR
ncbi:MAG: MBL fold metallo-hydrolase [Acidobacteria bacterium]|nr:MBL fold metallo-hydrolase [Acidobacteriota bacterium]